MCNLVEVRGTARDKVERDFNDELETVPRDQPSKRNESIVTDLHASTFGQTYRSPRYFHFETVKHIPFGPTVFPISSVAPPLDLGLPDNPDTANLTAMSAVNRNMANQGYYLTIRNVCT
jgi:hypothetical protein